ncbi:MAG: hypothetical protein ABJA35_01330 [Parafilimonas sp.]
MQWNLLTGDKKEIYKLASESFYVVQVMATVVQIDIVSCTNTKSQAPFKGYCV